MQEKGHDIFEAKAVDPQIVCGLLKKAKLLNTNKTKAERMPDNESGKLVGEVVYESI